MPKHEIILRFRNAKAAELLAQALRGNPLTSPFLFGRDGRNVICRYDRKAPAIAMLEATAKRVRAREKAIAAWKRVNPKIGAAMERTKKKRELVQISYYPPMQRGKSYRVAELLKAYPEK